MKSQPYILREDDLATQLRALGIRCAPGSPLRALALRPPDGPSPTKLPLESELRTAITATARPGIELGVLLSPPHSLGALWFYRTDQSELIGHLRDAVGNHIFVVTSDAELAEHVRACLGLANAAPVRRLSLDLSREAFAALIGLVDRNREWSLRSLLDRMPAPHRTFLPKETVDALYRGIDAGDWRWLGGLMQGLCPFDIALNDAACASGFGELTDKGLLKRERDGWAPAGPMHFLFASLASPVAYCAIHGRRHTESASTTNHVAAFRGLGVVWLVQFIDGRIRIDNANREELDLALSRSLFEWIRNPPPPRPVPELAAEAPQRPSATVIMTDPDENAPPRATDTKPPTTLRMNDVGEDETVDDLRCKACDQLVEGGLKCPNCGARLS